MNDFGGRFYPQRGRGTHFNGRYTGTALLIFLLITSCADPTNDLEIYGLEGDVVKYYAMQYEAEKRYGQWEVGKKSRYGHSLVTFTEDGFMEETLYFDRSGNDVYRQQNDYDGGVLAEMRLYEGDSLLSRSIMTSADGKVREVEEYNSEGELETRLKYAYGGGRLTSIDRIVGDRRIPAFTYIFSGDKLSKQTEYDTLGNVRYVYTYAYNDRGDVSAYNSLEEDGEIGYTIAYDYEYDDRGSWIKRYETNAGEMEHITLRNILYRDELEKDWSEEGLSGTWYAVESNDWIILNPDGTYDMGYRATTDDRGLWRAAEEEGILTIESDESESAEELIYNFDEFGNLVLLSEGGENQSFERR